MATAPAPDPDGLGGPSPTREERIADEIASDLEPAVAEAESVSAELVSAAALDLDTATAGANAVVDELLGQLDADLTYIIEPVSKLLKRVDGEVAKGLATAATDLAQVGILIPWSPAEMDAAVNGDWVQLVANAVPTLGMSLGVAPAVPPPPSWSGSQTVSVPTAAELAGSDLGGADLSADGTVPAVTDWRAEAQAAIDRIYNPPPQPTAPDRPRQQNGPCPEPCPCQCPEVNVTVNVPPIALPYSPARVEQLPGQQPIAAAIPAAIPAAAPAVPPTSPGVAQLAWPQIVGFSHPSTVGGINWNEPGSCTVVSDAASNPFRGPTRQEPAQAMDRLKQLDPFDLFQISHYDFWTQAAGPAAADLSKVLVNSMSGLAIMRSIWNTSEAGQIKTIESWVENAVVKLGIDQIAPQSVPNKAAAVYYAGRLGIAASAEKYAGVPLMYLYQADTYALQWSNPQYLPGQVRVDAAYLAGQIDDATWVCWTRANGNLPEPARKIMLADQNKLTITENIALHMRGVFNREVLHRRARDLGFLFPNYVDELLVLAQALPTQSDLIRFMSRDAADDAVAKKYGYDAEFEDKFTPIMQRWAKSLGLDDTYFRYQWRAHWNIPSFTQLSEMLARLRPDRPEMNEWQAAVDAQTETDKLLNPIPMPEYVTPEDVAEALRIDDVAPGWVQRLMAISTNPINRTDSVRAYMIGAFDEERLYHAFRDVQYSDRDARTLVEFYKQDKARRGRNLSGTWSVRKTIRYYKSGWVNREQAFDLLRPLFPSDRATNDTLELADQELAADLRAAQLKALKRGFLYGEFSERTTAQLMRQFGMDGPQAERMLALWTVERDGRFRQPTIAMLTKWLKANIIDVEQMRARLVNLGYRLTDADRIIASALKWSYEGEAPTPDELSGAVTEMIRSQKEAKGKATSWLQDQAKKLEQSLIRVRAELLRRLSPRERNDWNPLTIP